MNKKKNARKMLLFILSFLVCCTLFFIYSKQVRSETMKKEIQIYKINRETFYSFLENPSVIFFDTDSSKMYSYFEEDWYITYNVTRFHIQKPFIDFVGNFEKISNFLFENKIYVSDIEKAVVFEAPNIPLTIWIKSNIENIYITINEKIEDEGYIYRVYFESEYYEKYRRRDALLLVDGKYIETNIPIKMYHEYADIPLVVTMEALGSNIVMKNDTEYLVEVNNKRYYLDIESVCLYEEDNRNLNLLHQIDGGAIFIYKYNNEIMINSQALNSLLCQMNMFINVKCDIENETVIITRKETQYQSGDGSVIDNSDQSGDGTNQGTVP